MNGFEIKILDFIKENFSCRFLDLFFKYFTKLGGFGVMIFIVVVLLVIRKTRKTGITAALALIMGLLVGNLILKNIFMRTRPYDYNTAVKMIVGAEHDYSFPSGHSLASFEVAVSVFLHNKKIGIAAIITAFFIAFSRLYLYVHYPTDVLTGIFLGSLIAIFSKYIFEKTTEKYPNLKRKLRIE